MFRLLYKEAFYNEIYPDLSYLIQKCKTLEAIIYYFGNLSLYIRRGKYCFQHFIIRSIYGLGDFRRERDYL